ncbi:type VII secretion protein EccB [Allocatelliglobosispora scoriae]|uniref:Type VII secretion protein EccB n=1 Tax=Allocatelliglobosispora scoriae TaxID=643052 RepID=A0A841BQF5_9ACTN|nr:type VII secretion protein EccB [Allocatelliglobosispora scoriae]
MQRVVSALVVRETDPAQSPFRRVAVAALASLMIAMVGVAGFAVYGVFAGGSNADWKATPNSVIVEKESGASFVYRDGVLHPVRNLASALLIAGGGAPAVLQVGRSSLADTPRGSLLGITDAPDAVPAPEQLVSGAWTVCAATTPTAEAVSLLAIGDRSVGGRPLAEESATTVAAAGDPNTVYLLWRNRKYLVRGRGDGNSVLAALRMHNAPARSVDPAFLNAVPAGDPIVAPPLGPSGRSSYGDASVGDVFRFEPPDGGTPRYFAAVRDGLAEITALQANVLGQRSPTRTVGDAPPSNPRSLLPAGELAPPPFVPAFVNTGSAGLCATTTDDQGVREIRFNATVPDLSALSRTAGERKGTRAVIADYVLVEPGRGVLVEGFTTAGTSGGVVSLVTDLGQQFALENAAARAALGFATTVPVRMPTALVALLPEGPRLGVDDAMQAVTLS